MLGTGLQLAKVLVSGEGARIGVCEPVPGAVESVRELGPPVARAQSGAGRARRPAGEER